MRQFTKFLPLLVTLAATVGAVIYKPEFVAAHPQAFLVLTAVSQVLHAGLPSIFGGPQNPPEPPPPVQ